MKLLSLLLLTIFLGKGCDSENKQEIDAAVIEYVANTRGFYQKIIVEKQLVTISKERNDQGMKEVVKVSDKEWKELIDLFQDVNLDEIKDLKSPTEKRFYDGAAIANIKIIYKGITYESQSFDHGFPPYQIKKLVNKINSFAKQKDED